MFASFVIIILYAFLTAFLSASTDTLLPLSRLQLRIGPNNSILAMA